MNELLKDAFPAQAPAGEMLSRVQAAAAARAVLRARRRRNACAAVAIGGPLTAFIVLPSAIFALHAGWVARSEAILQTDRQTGGGVTTTHYQPDFFVEIAPGGGGRLVSAEGAYWHDKALGVEVFKPRTAPDAQLTPWGPSTPVSQLRPDDQWKGLPNFGMWLAPFTGFNLVIPTGVSSAKLGKTQPDGTELSWEMHFSDGLLRDVKTTKSGKTIRHLTTERGPKLTPGQAKRELLGYSDLAQVRLKDWYVQTADALPKQPVGERRDRRMSAQLLGVWPVEESLAVMLIQYSGEPAPDGGFLPLQRMARGSDPLAVRPLWKGISEAKGARRLEAVFAPMSAALAAWPEANAEPKPIFDRAGWMSLSLGSASALGAEAELDLALAGRLSNHARRPALQDILDRPGLDNWPEIAEKARQMMSDSSISRP